MQFLRQHGVFHHSGGESHFRRTAASKRMVLGVQMATTNIGAMEEFERRLIHANLDQVAAGNFSAIRNPAFWQRVRQEAAAANNLHSNILVELMMLYNLLREACLHPHFPGYIQKLQIFPLCIVCFKPEQIEETCRGLKEGAALYADASGLLIKRLDFVQKRVLLYTIVMDNRNDGSPCVPVLDMLSETHDITSLMQWLLVWKSALEKQSKGTVLKIISG